MGAVGFLGIGVRDGHMLDPSAERLRSEGYDISVRAFDAVTMDSDLSKLMEFLDCIGTLDFLVIHVHGDVSYFKHFDEALARIESSDCSCILTCTEPETTAKYRYLCKQGDAEFAMIRRLQEVGGDDNQYASLRWFLRHVMGEDVDVPEPVIPMAEGVYYPETGPMPLDDGLKNVGSTGKPVICIFFHQKYWLVHNTASVDMLISAVRRKDAEVLPIFAVSSQNDSLGSMGVKRIVLEKLIRDGKPIVDVIINTMSFSQTLTANPGSGEQVCEDNFFETLGVPVIQAITLYSPVDSWRESPFGLTPSEISMCVVNPEFDGQIDTVPYSGNQPDETGVVHTVGIADRCGMIADTAYRWAKLRHIPDDEKRIAILLYQYPPRQDMAAGGYGLDTFESVASLLRTMNDSGYSLDWVPEDGRDLMERMLAGVTNDPSWMSEDALRKASVDTVKKGQYAEWIAGIPSSMRDRLIDAWGEPPGDHMVIGDEQLLPGIANGNIFIGFQPDRGKCSSIAYHDPLAAAPHQYLGFYRWLRDVWRTDAVVHVGTHGTLEWLPGKSVGLSGECDPDVVLGNIPNVNPYIIDNPGEGMQAKRRSYAVITTHMIPALTRAGGYDGLDELEDAVQAFLKAEEQGQDAKLPGIMDEIRRIADETGIGDDIDLDGDISEAADRLYDYILEIKDAMIKDGLHILGEVPDGELMVETLYSLVRYRNGDVPSLRAAAASSMGLDLDDLLEDPSGMLPDGRLKGEALDSADAMCCDILRHAVSCGFDPADSISYAQSVAPGEDASAAVEFVCGFLREAIGRMPDEIGNILAAFGGRFVPPGPSGCPNRGRAQILPTGRNFYSIDPDGVPWHSSWDIGSEMAEQMVSRYKEEHGAYPRSIGIILWATDTMKTGGDDVAYVLRLMGLRPVWTGYGGRVKGLEVIPIEELGRPRLDVTMRISGLFRDTFPNLCTLLDEGVLTVGSLDESEEENYLADNLRRETAEAIISGMPPDVARREASMRIFGDAPGTYGCGVSDAVRTSGWDSVDDLSDIYVDRGCYVYGKGLKGESRPDSFRRRLGSMDVTVKNHNSRAVDMLDMDDDMDYLGGMNAVVRSIKGSMPESFMGDSSDTDHLKLRTAEEECRLIFRSKIDNPKWLEGLKRHGFCGAKEVSKLFDFTLGWSATSDIVDKRMFDDLAQRFVLDDATREWIRDENPYAMMNMLSRLFEAAQRGLWDADPEMLDKLRDVYSDFEGRIEELTDLRTLYHRHGVYIQYGQWKRQADVPVRRHRGAGRYETGTPAEYRRSRHRGSPDKGREGNREIHCGEIPVGHPPARRFLRGLPVQLRPLASLPRMLGEGICGRDKEAHEGGGAPAERHRGPRGRDAGYRTCSEDRGEEIRTRGAGTGQRQPAVRRRGEPARRPSRGSSARLRRHGCQLRREGGRVVLPPVPLRPRRDHESGGGRPEAAAPGQVRPFR